MHSIALMCFHLSLGQLHGAPCTAEWTLYHLEGTLLEMHFKLNSFQISHGTFVWTFHGEQITERVMHLSDYVMLVVIAAMLAHA